MIKSLQKTTDVAGDHFIVIWHSTKIVSRPFLAGIIHHSALGQFVTNRIDANTSVLQVNPQRFKSSAAARKFLRHTDWRQLGVALFTYTGLRTIS